MADRRTFSLHHSGAITVAALREHHARGIAHVVSGDLGRRDGVVIGTDSTSCYALSVPMFGRDVAA